MRYLVSAAGTYRLHAENRHDCSDGHSSLSTVDYLLTVSTAKPQRAWVSTGPHSPTPPGYSRSGPGIYGFRENGWMTFRWRVHKSEHTDYCDRHTDEHCNQAGPAAGRFEGPQGPSRMYLVTAGGGDCGVDFPDNFVEDLHGNSAYAHIPTAAILHRIPSKFSYHRFQQQRFSAWRATASIDWDASIAPADELVAVAMASSVERGGRVTLDGSKSFKGIKSYRWKLTRGKGCPDRVAFAPQTLHGPKLRFQALCPFKAELTVSDGKDSDSDTITVPVKARRWQTPHSRAPRGVLNTRLVNGHLQAGRNVCAYDGLTGDQRSGHMLHRSGPGGDYDPTGGFTIAGVTTGPFKGNFYVATYRTKIRRAALVSGDFDSNDLWTANAQAGDANDFYAFKESVRDHEELHSTLIERALPKSDRAKAIEEMVGDDRDAVAQDANVALVELEQILTDATSEKNVVANMPSEWNRPATVMVRDGAGGFVQRKFPSLAELGENG